jgi:F-type H+-transporting ATPase subunit c
MEPDAAKLIGAGLAMIGVAGSGVGIGIVVQGMLLAQGRNPEVAGELRTNMILGIVFCESIAIYAMVIAFMLLFLF